jgi:hypothetical protein
MLNHLAPSIERLSSSQTDSVSALGGPPFDLRRTLDRGVLEDIDITQIWLAMPTPVRQLLSVHLQSSSLRAGQHLRLV